MSDIEERIKAAKQHLQELYEEREQIRAAEHANKPSMAKKRANKEKRRIALEHFLDGMTAKGACIAAGLPGNNNPWSKLRKAWGENYHAHLHHHWEVNKGTGIYLDAEYLRAHPPLRGKKP